MHGFSKRLLSLLLVMIMAFMPAISYAETSVTSGGAISIEVPSTEDVVPGEPSTEVQLLNSVDTGPILRTSESIPESTWVKGKGLYSTKYLPSQIYTCDISSPNDSETGYILATNQQKITKYSDGSDIPDGSTFAFRNSTLGTSAELVAVKDDKVCGVVAVDITSVKATLNYIQFNSDGENYIISRKYSTDKADWLCEVDMAVNHNEFANMSEDATISHGAVLSGYSVIDLVGDNNREFLTVAKTGVEITPPPLTNVESPMKFLGWYKLDESAASYSDTITVPNERTTYKMNIVDTTPEPTFFDTKYSKAQVAKMQTSTMKTYQDGARVLHTVTDVSPLDQDYDYIRFEKDGSTLKMIGHKDSVNTVIDDNLEVFNLDDHSFILRTTSTIRMYYVMRNRGVIPNKSYLIPSNMTKNAVDDLVSKPIGSEMVDVDDVNSLFSQSKTIFINYDSLAQLGTKGESINGFTMLGSSGSKNFLLSLNAPAGKEFAHYVDLASTQYDKSITTSNDVTLSAKWRTPVKVVKLSENKYSQKQVKLVSSTIYKPGIKKMLYQKIQSITKDKKGDLISIPDGAYFRIDHDPTAVGAGGFSLILVDGSTETLINDAMSVHLSSTMITLISSDHTYVVSRRSSLVDNDTILVESAPQFSNPDTDVGADEMITTKYTLTDGYNRVYWMGLTNVGINENIYEVLATGSKTCAPTFAFNPVDKWKFESWKSLVGEANLDEIDEEITLNSDYSYNLSGTIDNRDKLPPHEDGVFQSYYSGDQIMKFVVDNPVDIGNDRVTLKLNGKPVNDSGVPAGKFDTLVVSQTDIKNIKIKRYDNDGILIDVLSGEYKSTCITDDYMILTSIHNDKSGILVSRRGAISNAGSVHVDISNNYVKDGKLDPNSTPKCTAKYSIENTNLFEIDPEYARLTFVNPHNDWTDNEVMLVRRESITKLPPFDITDGYKALKWSSSVGEDLFVYDENSEYIPKSNTLFNIVINRGLLDSRYSNPQISQFSGPIEVTEQGVKYTLGPTINNMSDVVDYKFEFIDDGDSGDWVLRPDDPSLDITVTNIKFKTVTDSYIYFTGIRDENLYHFVIIRHGGHCEYDRNIIVRNDEGSSVPDDVKTMSIDTPHTKLENFDDGYLMFRYHDLPEFIDGLPEDSTYIHYVKSADNVSELLVLEGEDETNQFLGWSTVKRRKLLSKLEDTDSSLLPGSPVYEYPSMRVVSSLSYNDIYSNMIFASNNVTLNNGWYIIDNLRPIGIGRSGRPVKDTEILRLIDNPTGDIHLALFEKDESEYFGQIVDIGLSVVYSDTDVTILKTTVGKVILIFNEVYPTTIPFSTMIKKSDGINIVDDQFTNVSNCSGLMLNARPNVVTYSSPIHGLVDPIIIPADKNETSYTPPIPDNDDGYDRWTNGKSTYLGDVPSFVSSGEYYDLSTDSAGIGVFGSLYSLNNFYSVSNLIYDSNQKLVNATLEKPATVQLSDSHSTEDIVITPELANEFNIAFENIVSNDGDEFIGSILYSSNGDNLQHNESMTFVYPVHFDYVSRDVLVFTHNSKQYALTQKKFDSGSEVKIPIVYKDPTNEQLHDDILFTRDSTRYTVTYCAYYDNTMHNLEMTYKPGESLKVEDIPMGVPDTHEIIGWRTVVAGPGDEALYIAVSDKSFKVTKNMILSANISEKETTPTAPTDGEGIFATEYTKYQVFGSQPISNLSLNEYTNYPLERPMVKKDGVVKPLALDDIPDKTFFMFTTVKDSLDTQMRDVSRMYTQSMGPTPTPTPTVNLGMYDSEDRELIMYVAEDVTNISVSDDVIYFKNPNDTYYVITNSTAYDDDHEKVIRSAPERLSVSPEDLKTVEGTKCDPVKPEADDVTTLTYIVSGEPDLIQAYKPNTTVKIDYKPTSSSAVFVHWVRDDNSTVQIGQSVIIEDNPIKLTAYFKQIVDTHSIEYYVDGKLYKTDVVEDGERTIFSDGPAREGYYFNGWTIRDGVAMPDLIDIGGTLHIKSVKYDMKFDAGYVEKQPEEVCLTFIDIRGIHRDIHIIGSKVNTTVPREAGCYVINEDGTPVTGVHIGLNTYTLPSVTKSTKMKEVQIPEKDRIPINTEVGSDIYSDQYPRGSTVVIDDPTLPGFTFIEWRNSDGTKFQFDKVVDSTGYVNNLQKQIELIAFFEKDEIDPHKEANLTAPGFWNGRYSKYQLFRGHFIDESRDVFVEDLEVYPTQEMFDLIPDDVFFMFVKDPKNGESMTNVELIAYDKDNKFIKTMDYGVISKVGQYGFKFDRNGINSPIYVSPNAGYDLSKTDIIYYKTSEKELTYQDSIKDTLVSAIPLEHGQSRNKRDECTIINMTSDRGSYQDKTVSTVVRASSIVEFYNPGKVDDYKFVGWKDDKTKVVYTDKNEYRATMDDVDFTATWVKATTVNLPFECHYQDGSHERKNVELYVGDVYTFDIRLPDRNGQAHCGWTDAYTGDTYALGDTMVIADSSYGFTAVYSDEVREIQFKVEDKIQNITVGVGTTYTIPKTMAGIEVNSWKWMTEDWKNDESKKFLLIPGATIVCDKDKLVHMEVADNVKVVEKIKEVEKIVEKPVEVIKYVKSGGGKTKTIYETETIIKEVPVEVVKEVKVPGLKEIVLPPLPKNATRGEIARYIGVNLQIPLSDVEYFSDTKSKLIAGVHEAGIVKGYGDGTFRPDQVISDQEFEWVADNLYKYMIKKLYLETKTK